MNKMSYKAKVPGKSIGGMPKGGSVNFKGGKPSGKLDCGFYGHLTVESCKEDSQIRTSVHTYAEGC